MIKAAKDIKKGEYFRNGKQICGPIQSITPTPSGVLRFWFPGGTYAAAGDEYYEIVEPQTKLNPDGSTLPPDTEVDLTGLCLVGSPEEIAMQVEHLQRTERSRHDTEPPMTDRSAQRHFLDLGRQTRLEAVAFAEAQVIQAAKAQPNKSPRLIDALVELDRARRALAEGK